MFLWRSRETSTFRSAGASQAVGGAAEGERASSSEPALELAAWAKPQEQGTRSGVKGRVQVTPRSLGARFRVQPVRGRAARMLFLSAGRRVARGGCAHVYSTVSTPWVSGFLR